MPRSGKRDALACTSQCDSPVLMEQGCAAGLSSLPLSSTDGSNPQEEKTATSHLLISYCPW